MSEHLDPKKQSSLEEQLDKVKAMLKRHLNGGESVEENLLEGDTAHTSDGDTEDTPSVEDLAAQLKTLKAETKRMREEKSMPTAEEASDDVDIPQQKKK